MRFTSLFLAMALYAFSLVNSATIVDPIKCQMNCDLQDFKPICGTNEAGDTKTFNNQCIMKTENCLKILSFQKTSDGECP